MLRPPFSLFDASSPRSGCGVLLIVLAASACASTPDGLGARAESQVLGSYEGRFVFGNDGFESTLQLRSAGPGRVSGAFRVSDPIEIQGVVSGVVVDDLLRIRVTWRGPDGCDGTIEGILDIEDGGADIRGPVSVSDCGPPVAGRMRFARVGRNPRGSARRSAEPLPLATG